MSWNRSRIPDTHCEPGSYRVFVPIISHPHKHGTWDCPFPIHRAHLTQINYLEGAKLGVGPGTLTSNPFLYTRVEPHELEGMILNSLPWISVPSLSMSPLLQNQILEVSTFRRGHR